MAAPQEHTILVVSTQHSVQWLTIVLAIGEWREEEWRGRERRREGEKRREGRKRMGKGREVERRGGKVEGSRGRRGAGRQKLVTDKPSACTHPYTKERKTMVPPGSQCNSFKTSLFISIYTELPVSFPCQPPLMKGFWW